MHAKYVQTLDKLTPTNSLSFLPRIRTWNFSLPSPRPFARSCTLSPRLFVHFPRVFTCRTSFCSPLYRFFLSFLKPSSRVFLHREENNQNSSPAALRQEKVALFSAKIAPSQTTLPPTMHDRLLPLFHSIVLGKKWKHPLYTPRQEPPVALEFLGMNVLM